MTTRDHAREAASEALHTRGRAFVDAFDRSAEMPESFDALGCDIARHQARHVAPYRKLIDARGIDPAALARISDAPAVPTDAFKMTRVFAFPELSEGECQAVFRTSGTSIGARGTHCMRTARTYDEAAVAFGRWALMHGRPARVPILVIGPRPGATGDSSLGHMIARFVAAFGEPASPAETYFVDDGTIDLMALDARVARLIVGEGGPALVMGTSFAFVHLLEGMDDLTFRLPGSRVMQTGGFKGKSREVPADELRSDLSRVFCIEPSDVVCEYGMTELSSQFYEVTARGEGRPGVYREPPWARVEPVDPVTLVPVPDGEIGVARIVDLMNVDSAVAVLAADRVRRVPGGFELLGRAPGAPPRGCSIALDEMLA